MHRHDDSGRAIQEVEDVSDISMAIQLDDVECQVANSVLQGYTGALELAPKALASDFNERVKKAARIGVSTTSGSWVWDVTTGQVVASKAGRSVELGLGRLVVKAKVGKSNKVAVCRVEATLEPLMQKDVEHIEYCADELKNQKIVEDYLIRWLREPASITKVTVGCEINFNKIFPRLSSARSTKEVLVDIAALNRKMTDLERQFETALGGGR